MQLKEYTRSLLVEAKWLKEGYMPTLKEYMSNSLLTSAYPLMLALSYVGRDRDIFTEESFEWVASYPPHVKALASIIRLMDDIVTHEVPHIHLVFIQLFKSLISKDWYVHINL